MTDTVKFTKLLVPFILYLDSALSAGHVHKAD